MKHVEDDHLILGEHFVDNDVWQAANRPLEGTGLAAGVLGGEPLQSFRGRVDP